MLDVSMVLMDPLISDTFDVRRNSESVDQSGRTTTVSDWHRGLTGVITPQEPSKLERRDDGQLVPHTIMVHTAFALRDSSFGFQPDVVLWNGIEYLVTAIQPYQRMAGFTQALATSTRTTDTPQ